MILPSDAKCRQVIKELDGDRELSQWEADFIASNRNRETFTTAQKEVIARLLDKFDV